MPYAMIFRLLRILIRGLSDKHPEPDYMDEARAERKVWHELLNDYQAGKHGEIWTESDREFLDAELERERELQMLDPPEERFLD